ncbi:septum formation initiator family protein [Polycyclovorans algicola]|uniref:septum formation initiator family protein n=1 Tax=Polycyclovorans algicola TaxID=616992 RepID=UPI0004A6ED26|nr:septum formation initiator family protein [Polycyclovorans algicola]
MRHPRRLVTVVLALMLVALQWRLWVAEGGISHTLALQTQVKVVASELEQLSLRNAQLAAEVQDLDTGSQAIEGRARNALGMIANGETFYLVVAPGAE